MPCERGCQPGASLGQGWLLPPRFLTVPLYPSLSLSHSFSLSLSPASRLVLFALYSPFFLPCLSLSLSPSSHCVSVPSHPIPVPFLPLSRLVCRTSCCLLPCWPASAAPRLRDDVNFHAHVFQPPHQRDPLRVSFAREFCLFASALLLEEGEGKRKRKRKNEKNVVHVSLDPLDFLFKL